jgi:hypothetical protein
MRAQTLTRNSTDARSARGVSEPLHSRTIATNTPANFSIARNNGREVCVVERQLSGLILSAQKRSHHNWIIFVGRGFSHGVNAETIHQL